jgi:molybdenum cofactor biosynthesis protein B
MTSKSSAAHHRIADERGPVRIGLVTVSDSRTIESDENGRYLKERITAAGHEPAGYIVIPDEPALVTDAVKELATAGAQVIILNGGTGIAPRDTTFDALTRLIERPIPGFGELFRMLSYEQIGAAAMLSRATAGTYRGVVIISVPGSPAAVRLAWEKLIEPEIPHLAWQVARGLDS